MSTSQRNTLLSAFKDGHVLTAQSAYIRFGISTFSQRISDIERLGYEIARAWITAPNGKRFMQYWLIKKVDCYGN